MAPNHPSVHLFLPCCVSSFPLVAPQAQAGLSSSLSGDAIRRRRTLARGILTGCCARCGIASGAGVCVWDLV
ncbi:hypothetical protein LZ32DRAFT_608004 [Colletotrichum eremochloae]|nr:hypothetical protein LZ32DRAFT_608004 [Colletotrichum eremochloae]